MDRATHRRYLAYRESFPYFRPQSEAMLTMAEFAELEGALSAIDAIPEAGRSPEDTSLRERLVKLLLKD